MQAILANPADHDWRLGTVPALLPAATIVCRPLDEEKHLARNLPGYADYQRSVLARLVPGGVNAPPRRQRERD